MPPPPAAPQKNYLLVTLLGSFWNILQFIVSFVVAITISILLTRHFAPNDYGLYAYVTWFSSIMLMIFNLGILSTVQTWVPKFFFTNQLPKAAFIARKLFTAQVLILGGGLVALIPLIFVWHRFVTFPPKIFTMLMLINLVPMFASILNIFLSTLLVSLQRFKKAVLIYIAGQLLLLTAAIIVTTQHWGLLGLLLMTGFVQVVMFVLFFYFSRDIFTKTIATWQDTGEIKKIISFSGWAYASTFLQAVIWDKSEFFFLGKYHVGRAVAVYGIAYTLANMVTTVLEPILSVFSTILSELVAKQDWDRIRLIIRLCAKYVSLLLLPLTTLAYALSTYVIRWVYGPEYLLVAAVFPVLLLSTTMSRIFSPAWAIPTYMHDLRRFVSRIAIFAPINIILDFLLIPRYGVWGATIANVATQLLALLYYSRFVQRYGLQLFTADFLKVVGLNAVFFMVIALSVHPTESFLQSCIISLISLMFYAIIAYKKLINQEDRQLIINSIRTVRQRPAN